MRPIETEHTTGSLKAPPGMDNCVDRPVIRGVDPDGSHYVISAWGMTWKERLKALWTGVVWLTIAGHTHPPVAVEIDGPFNSKKGRA